MVREDKANAALLRDSIEFNLGPSTVVWSPLSEAAVTLKKLHADSYPSANAVIGYEPWKQQAKMPKALEPKVKYICALGPTARAIFQTTAENKIYKMLFVIRLEDKKSRLVPAGVVLVNLKEHSIEAGAQIAAT